MPPRKKNQKKNPPDEESASSPKGTSPVRDQDRDEPVLGEGDESVSNLDYNMVYFDKNKAHACLFKGCRSTIVATDHHVICNKHLPREHVLDPPSNCKACAKFHERTIRKRKEKYLSMEETGEWPVSTPSKKTPNKTPAKSSESKATPKATSTSHSASKQSSASAKVVTPARETSPEKEIIEIQGEEGEDSEEDDSESESGSDHDGGSEIADQDGSDGQGDNDQLSDGQVDDGHEPEEEAPADKVQSESDSAEEPPQPKTKTLKRSKQESDSAEEPPQPKTKTLKRSKQEAQLLKLEKERKRLKKRVKLARLKKKLGSKKRSKKRHWSSSSSELSSSSSSSSSSESEESPPPKRSRKRQAPPISTPAPDQAAMVQEIMDAMKSLHQESQQAIEERMQRLEAASAGLPKDSLPARDAPSLSGAKSASSSSSSREKQSSKDEESDEEPSEARTSLSSHTRRRETMKQYLTDQAIFNFNVPPVSREGAAAQAQFGHSAPEPQKEVLIVQEGMIQELAKHAEKRLSKGFKKPDKLLNKMYKCPWAQNKNWSEPPGINTNLQNIVEHTHKQYDSKKKQWSLNQKHVSGKEEQKLLPIIARQQLLLKIVNCSTMALVAAQGSLAMVMNDIPNLSRYLQDSTFDLAAWQSEVCATLNDSFSCFQEAQINSIDILRLSADSLFSALEDRRRLWLSSSRLTADQQAQLNAEAVNLPSSSVDDSEWGILSPESDELVKSWSERFESDKSAAANNLILKFQTQRNPAVKNIKGQGQGPTHNKKSTGPKSFPTAAAGQESSGKTQNKSGGGSKPFTKKYQPKKGKHSKPPKKQ
jgi:hypothetical protein